MNKSKDTISFKIAFGRDLKIIILDPTDAICLDSKLDYVIPMEAPQLEKVEEEVLKDYLYFDGDTLKPAWIED